MLIFHVIEDYDHDLIITEDVNLVLEKLPEDVNYLIINIWKDGKEIRSFNYEKEEYNKDKVYVDIFSFL